MIRRHRYDAAISQGLKQLPAAGNAERDHNVAPHACLPLGLPPCLPLCLPSCGFPPPILT
ncbi:hypothetical protein GbCGDNIH1_8054 [Granulibacter bethesdensis CGDNIH1]|uniref:Uncharacterized protein n=1 Tax=Granulibacter bethesdensis (strain ATCC BAA-1260 / CGDNIH1) TaxID=391165 RepID=A0A286M2W1_GRABC|nr:hypothetical protein GbCGDNIH1_8054 [Granulibacter bethesdensis CGDNIH1]ASV62543.1 hypothetical protein GbCGDNIH1I4_8054 [Granulibacter bethesdensis]